MNPDGSDRVRLARWIPRWMQYHNIWSADGNTLAYIDTDNDTQRYWLSVVDGNGRNRRRLLDMTDLKMDSMALSPDGKAVVLSLDSTRVSKIETPRGGTVHIEITEEPDLDLFTVDVKTGKLKRLTDTPEVMEKWPAYSPDGKGLIFTNLLNVFELMVADADGKNPRTLAVSQDIRISMPFWLFE